MDLVDLLGELVLLELLCKRDTGSRSREIRGLHICYITEAPSIAAASVAEPPHFWAAPEA